MTNFLQLLTDKQRAEFWAGLALRHAKGLTPQAACALLTQYGSALTAFENWRDWRFSHAREAMARESWRTPAQKEWNAAKNFSGKILLWTDFHYPLGLKQIPDAPILLYAYGRLELLSKPAVAIVGSRRFTPYTRQKAAEIAQELARCGICIVSGLARGIDYAAHAAALPEEGGSIGVLGCGPDVVYPLENADLFHKMRVQGLIVSEFAPGTPPLAANFPVRNRIISGLSEGVLVAEAALRSGSLITARLALEQNRNVYALRPIDKNHSQGCQSILEDGALEIADALGIITDIAPNLYREAARTQNLQFQEKKSCQFSVNHAKPCDKTLSSKNALLPAATDDKTDCESIKKLHGMTDALPEKPLEGDAAAKMAGNGVQKFRDENTPQKSDSTLLTEAFPVAAAPIKTPTVDLSSQKSFPEATQILSAANRPEETAKEVKSAAKPPRCGENTRPKVGDPLRAEAMDFGSLAANFLSDVPSKPRPHLLRTKKYAVAHLLPQQAENQTAPAQNTFFFCQQQHLSRVTHTAPPAPTPATAPPATISPAAPSPAAQSQNKSSPDKSPDCPVPLAFAPEYAEKFAALSPLQQKLLHLLAQNSEPFLDQLLEMLPLEEQDAGKISAAMLILEVKKLVTRLPGMRYALVQK